MPKSTWGEVQKPDKQLRHQTTSNSKQQPITRSKETNHKSHSNSLAHINHIDITPNHTMIHPMPSDSAIHTATRNAQKKVISSSGVNYFSLFGHRFISYFTTLPFPIHPIPSDSAIHTANRNAQKKVISSSGVNYISFGVGPVVGGGVLGF